MCRQEQSEKVRASEIHLHPRPVPESGGDNKATARKTETVQPEGQYYICVLLVCLQSQ